MGLWVSFCTPGRETLLELSEDKWFLRWWSLRWYLGGQREPGGNLQNMVSGWEGAQRWSTDACLGHPEAGTMLSPKPASSVLNTSGCLQGPPRAHSRANRPGNGMNGGPQNMSSS